MNAAPATRIADIRAGRSISADLNSQCADEVNFRCECASDRFRDNAIKSFATQLVQKTVVFGTSCVFRLKCVRSSLIDFYGCIWEAKLVTFQSEGSLDGLIWPRLSKPPSPAPTNVTPTSVAAFESIANEQLMAPTASPYALRNLTSECPSSGFLAPMAA